MLRVDRVHPIAAAIAVVAEVPKVGWGAAGGGLGVAVAFTMLEGRAAPTAASVWCS